MWRDWMPAVLKTREMRPKLEKRAANTWRAISAISSCAIQWGAAAVASEIKLARGMLLSFIECQLSRVHRVQSAADYVTFAWRTGKVGIGRLQIESSARDGN